MLKMKKILAVILAMLMLLSLAACGKGDNTGLNNSQNKAAENTDNQGSQNSSNNQQGSADNTQQQKALSLRTLSALPS
jgi:predicted small lipoprotein YifL